ncbi:hypothetical protein F5Y02DRAFT_365493 [Annulohypoxylon stygium]|nr:hypothetical protein F5Y02DRAFT_365493 [Annulohypoxylon stygium]
MVGERLDARPAGPAKGSIAVRSTDSDVCNAAHTKRTVEWVWPLVWANMLIYVWATYEKAPARHDVRVQWTGRPLIAIPADSTNIIVIIGPGRRKRVSYELRDQRGRRR